MKKKKNAWWNSLSDERKSEITNYYEHKRDKPEIIKRELPELTQDQIRHINQNMLNIGMERFIVLREEGELLYWHLSPNHT